MTIVIIKRTHDTLHSVMLKLAKRLWSAVGCFAIYRGANPTPHASHSTQRRLKRIIGLIAFECDFNIVDRVQIQSSLYLSFLGFCFAARQAQPAIPEEFLKALADRLGLPLSTRQILKPSTTCFSVLDLKPERLRQSTF